MNIFNSEHCIELLNDITEYYVTEQHVHLIFLCKENIEVKTHKMIFSSVSRLLKDILETDNIDVVYICLPDVDHKKLQVLVNFLYEGISKVNLDELISLKDIMLLLDIRLYNTDITGFNFRTREKISFQIRDKNEGDEAIKLDDYCMGYSTKNVAESGYVENSIHETADYETLYDDQITHSVSEKSESVDSGSRNISDANPFESPVRSTYEQDMEDTVNDIIRALGDTDKMETTTTCGRLEKINENHKVMSGILLNSNIGKRMTNRRLIDACMKNAVQDTNISENSYRCSVCGEIFKLEEEMSKHISNSMKNGIFYKCNKCERCFHKQKEYAVHLIKHSREYPFTCHICGQCFSWSRSLHNHVRQHNIMQNIYSFKCKICCNSYSKKQKSTKQTGEESSCLCHVCHKSFRRSGTFYKHMAAHDLHITSFVCNDCGKCFKKKDELIDHIARFHTIIDKYKCQTCKKCFASERIYFRHKLKHLSPSKKT